MNKQEIIDVVIDVVEGNMRKDKPQELSSEELEAMLVLGREHLRNTASKIADRLIKD